MGLKSSYERSKEQGKQARAVGQQTAGIFHLGHKHLDLPAESFLNQVAASIAPVKGVRVERPSPSNVTIHHRYTPGWAVAFGIVGLLFFLLGALLFFIKRTDTVSVIAVDSAAGGCDVTVSGRGPQTVAYALSALVYGQAENNYAAVPAAATT